MLKPSEFTSDLIFSITDQCLSDYEDELEEAAQTKFQRGHQRRLSDPSSSIDTWLKNGWRSKPGHRSGSESEGLDKWLNPALEIEAGDIRSVHCSATLTNVQTNNLILYPGITSTTAPPTPCGP